MASTTRSSSSRHRRGAGTVRYRSRPAEDWAGRVDQRFRLVPVPATTRSGSPPQSVASVASSAAPVGVHNSRSPGPAPIGAPARVSSSRLPGRHGKPTVLGRHRPATDRHCAHPSGHPITEQPERVQGDGAADDIGQRVKRADLVEVDLGDVHPVHPRLSGRQPIEHRSREGVHHGRQRRGGEQFGDLGRAAPGRTGCRPHHGVGGSKACRRTGSACTERVRCRAARARLGRRRDRLRRRATRRAACLRRHRVWRQPRARCSCGSP